MEDIKPIRAGWVVVFLQETKVKEKRKRKGIMVEIHLLSRQFVPCDALDRV